MADVTAGLEARKVPVGPVNSVAQALASDQAQARGMVRTMPRNGAPPVRVLGNPLNLSATPVQLHRPPPAFGADTQALRDWLDAPKSGD